MRLKRNPKKNTQKPVESAQQSADHVKITKGKKENVDLLAESKEKHRETDEKVTEILSAEPEEEVEPESKEPPRESLPPPQPDFNGPDKENRRYKPSSDYDTYQECVLTLFAHMSPCMYDCFKRMRNKCDSSEEFSKSLDGVSDWGPRQVSRRKKEIHARNSDETMHYFYYAYSANALVLANVISRNKEEIIELDIPDYNTFIRLAYAESARRLQNVPGVFDTDLEDWQRIGVNEKIDTIFGNSIRTAIRKMIPISKITPEMETQMFGSVNNERARVEQGISDSENEGYSSEEEEQQPPPRRRHRPQPVDEDDFDDEHDFGEEDMQEEEDEDNVPSSHQNMPTKTVHLTKGDLEYVDPLSPRRSYR